MSISLQTGRIRKNLYQARFKLDLMEKLLEQVPKYKTQALIYRDAIRVLGLMESQLHRITLERLSINDYSTSTGEYLLFPDH